MSIQQKAREIRKLIDYHALELIFEGNGLTYLQNIVLEFNLKRQLDPIIGNSEELRNFANTYSFYKFPEKLFENNEK